MPEKAELWIDETVFLDSASGTQASDWVTPPERYLALGNSIKVKFTFECFGVGPAAAVANAIELYVQRSAALTDASQAFANFGQSTLIQRDRVVITMSFGLGGGESGGYPQGVARVRLNNTDAANWASVRVRGWVELQAA